MKALMMPLLLLMGLQFWGWQLELFWLAGCLSAIFIVVVYQQGRYTFEITSFYHIANLCVLILAAAFAYFWLDEKVSKALFPTLQLLPLALMPMLMMQYLHQSRRVPSHAWMFFKRDKEAKHRWMDISPLFLVACLFSAGASRHSGYEYFLGASLLLLLLLFWLQRAVNFKTKLTLVLFFMAVVLLALVTQWTLNDLQNRLEARINQWILNQGHTGQGSTAIGEIGRLKLSDHIVSRVQTNRKITTPLLLQQGTYQRYHHGEWYSGAWADVQVPFSDGQWQLQDEHEPAEQYLRFLQVFAQDKATLALPYNSLSIKNLAAETLQVKQGASVQAQGLRPFSAFDVYYSLALPDALVISRSDVSVTKDEAVTIALIAQKLNLYQIKQEQGSAKALEVLKQYFNREFTYSTWLQAVPNRPNKQTALTSFLLQTKSGHCEYFATATVLLLREIGIASRYAVGYAMSEQQAEGAADADKGLFLVRERDAHAWALADIDGKWVVADFTPPNWLEIENQHRSSWQTWADMWSNLEFIFKQWRYGEDDKNTSMWLWLLAVLFAFLAFRLLRRVRTKSVSLEQKQTHLQDAAWQALEHDLLAAGYPRQHGQTLHSWFENIHEYDLFYLLDLYYLKRFSAQGLSEAEQKHLDQGIAELRDRLKEHLEQTK